MTTKANRVGERCGRLIVTGEKMNSRGRKAWLCRCDCGRTTEVESGNLREGRTSSCGCLRLEVQFSNIDSKTHGLRRHPEYDIWRGMLRRCHNAKHKDYRLWGGRGIKVCERWHSLENFIADMGPRPTPAHSLDRWPDMNGNYEPSNCRWATRIEQQNNKRSNHVVYLDGERLTLAQLAIKAGMKYATLSGRIRRGWSVERALTTPAG